LNLNDISVLRFCEWLDATRLSTEIKTIEWLIPTIQTIHILSISAVMGAAAMVNLRILGALPRTQSLAAAAHRFVPWIWWALLVLFLSGCTLIIGEPARSLPNPAFLLKMSMLAVVLLITLALQRGLRRDAGFWESSAPRRISGRLLAGVSLGLWVGIVFAGRWIAYIDVNAA
jgi:hypothetical protein